MATSVTIQKADLQQGVLCFDRLSCFLITSLFKNSIHSGILSENSRNTYQYVEIAEIKLSKMYNAKYRLFLNEGIL